MATIEGIRGHFKGRKYLLSDARVGVGRATDNRLSVPDDPSLSRHHAEIFYEDGEWYCRDCGSLNGTFVNNRQLHESPFKVKHSAVLGCGEQSFLIVCDGRGPRTAAEEKQPQEADWIGQGARVEVAGFELSSPMVYFGDAPIPLAHAKPSPDGIGGEPSLINPKYRVSRSASPHGLYEQVRYSAMTPYQRACYLQWLEGGRIADVQEPYVLLFLNGLERRLLQPKVTAPGQDEEIPKLLAEIRRLRANFPNYLRFQHFSLRLLARFWPISVDSVFSDFAGSLHPRASATNYFSGEDSGVSRQTLLSWGLGLWAQARGEMPSEALLPIAQKELARMHGSSTFSRYRVEIGQFLPVRFREQFGERIRLTPSEEGLRYVYRTLNPTVRAADEEVLIVPRAAEEPMILATMNALPAQCVDAFVPAARRFGTTSSAKRRLATLYFPEPIRRNSLVAEEIRSEVAKRVDESSPVPIIQLLNPQAVTSEIKRGDVIKFCELARELGFVIEPDALDPVVPVTSESTVVIRRASAARVEPISERCTSAKAALLVVLSVADATDSGPTAVTRLILDLIQRRFTLTPDEGLRVEALGAWACHGARKMTKALINHIAPEFRPLTGQILVEVTSSEVATTANRFVDANRWLALLGQAPAYSAPAQPGYLGLATISAASNPLGYRLPPPGANEGGIPAQPKPVKVQLDPALIEARIAETQEVSALLEDVFVSDSVVAPVVANRDADELAGLLNDLPDDEISLAAFQGLAKAHGLSANIALERLNDHALETLDALLIEGDDPLWIDGDTLAKLRENYGNP